MCRRAEDFSIQSMSARGKRREGVSVRELFQDDGLQGGWLLRLGGYGVVRNGARTSLLFLSYLKTEINRCNILYQRNAEMTKGTRTTMNGWESGNPSKPILFFILSPPSVHSLFGFLSHNPDMRKRVTKHPAR
jgi:hypothetical protein